MAPKNSRNKNNVSIFKMNTDDAKHQSNNPYLDASVLSDNAADDGMEISPLSAQKILGMFHCQIAIQNIMAYMHQNKCHGKTWKSLE